MKVLVCGGRDFDNTKVLFETLNNLYDSCHGRIEIVSGGALGADRLAEVWSSQRQIKKTIYPAKWNLLGAQAGLARNQEMLDKENPDLVVAFPGGRGTSHMIRIAKQSGYKVTEILAS